MSAGPTDAIAVPSRVRALAAGGPVRPVWRNELGGVTFEIGAGRFVKWAPAQSSIDLDAERVRLVWARPFTPVPDLLDHGRDGDGSWIVTRALPGESAVSPRWLAAPAVAVAAIGAGLRAFHDRLPVDLCPFSWSSGDRLADARRRAAAGLIRSENWHDDHRRLDLPGALAALERPPPIDRLVVCHGDTCAPNTLIGDDGRTTGHVDLGALGVADRWADLAIATWSTRWNYGDGWERALLDAYGIDPDEERTAYYRLLWDLGP
jgi:kanamycin kinase